MQTTDQFILILFGLMGFGLLVVFWSLAQIENNRPLHNWWGLSVGLYSGSALTFALIPWLHSTIQTLANIAIMGSLIFNALLFRSWREPIKEPLVAATWAVLVMLGIIYETLRQHSGFSERVTFVSVTFAICLIWQAYELACLLFARGPQILKFILLCVLLSLCVTLARTSITLSSNLSDALTIFNEQTVTRFLRWSGLATMLLTYLGIGAFFAQRQLAERRQMLDDLRAKESALSTQAEEKIEIQRLLDERNELVSSLIQAKKSAEAGALSAALAHELNQPLCAIQLNAECLQMELTSVVANPLINRELISRILADNKRASEIIASLKQVFSKTAVVAQRVDLIEVISSLEKLFLPLAKKENISLVQKYPRGVACHVQVNMQEFQHVLLNLLNNAIQALSDKKENERHIEISISKKDSCAYLSISDTGKGIDPSLQTSIFNLLSTTKFAGMGLGLWLSQHIIERHKGRLYLEKHPGWSTTFMIELPLND
jgi:signal transduction histidine kinase